MKSRLHGLKLLTVVLGLTCVCAVSGGARSQDGAAGGQGQGPGDERRVPVFGKITTMSDRSIEITDVNGEKVSIKLTDKTEFRKDRQAVKRSDFKVGDIILVRGDENADHSWTAQVIAARSMNGAGGRGGFGGPGGQGGGRDRAEFQREVGTLGKDFVAGEIKSVDAPKLSVMRTDNVTQTIELNEDTSLRNGRDAITMADIQAGDHVFARGGLENNVFVPKSVVVISSEQWKRMQEWSGQAGGPGQRRRGAGAGGPNGGGTGTAAPGASGAAQPPAADGGGADGGGSNTQKPPEPQN